MRISPNIDSEPVPHCSKYEYQLGKISPTVIYLVFFNTQSLQYMLILICYCYCVSDGPHSDIPISASTDSEPGMGSKYPSIPHCSKYQRGKISPTVC